MEPFIGEIRMFCGNFAPTGWALCDGQLMAIAQNSALFSILGTTFGGNGQTTFGLPDLRGRVPMHPGQGPGLSPRVLGEVAGTEAVTLLQPQIPTHSHTLNAANSQAGADSPTNGLLAQSFDQNANTSVSTYAAGNPNTTLSPASIGSAGGSQPHENLQPYTCVNFIIALEGVYPSRS
ncbi:MAG TPA: tail fiber protein [Holophagaceae bacterium]|nr:tail fiber protein [Holophagaceae bacterium]